MGEDGETTATGEARTDRENDSRHLRPTTCGESTASGGPTTRRGVLRALGGATALAAAPTVAERGAAQDDRTTIVLGARRDYWLGLQPRAIEGQRNPTLRLREGDRYRIVWVDLDGARHRFRLLDADGNVVNRTRPSDQRGATRATRFRGRPELAGYDCEFHPEQMNGSVELGEGFPTTRAAGETTEANQTAEANETTAGGGSGGVAEVAVGPEGDYFRFVPERVEIPVGGTVRWRFESAGHNVSARPEAARQVSLPEGAQPFSSYPEGESFRVVSEGETYEHAFSVPGEYTYVCVPHVGEGMIGTVVVTE
ncbi:plastocyanin/azurin family copper-binding protein [Halorussus caseinilyticus]|uniref:plastocyanin/azurin family copper-binding protein n=1 Tax=Halorussus caseinilyticus TaxID=3034025 RepID=UPI0023E7F2B8|nr:plastocyanin/azurin family copper-binding protein [Halorussus sp. DT72]